MENLLSHGGNDVGLNLSLRSVFALASIQMTLCLAAPAPASGPAPSSPLIDAGQMFRRYGLDELVLSPAAAAATADHSVAQFFHDNIPLFECPDADIQEIYYFRWGVYRKHIKLTSDGYVVTEFLPPVGWSGKHNTINCPAGHHFYEGRWLRDPKVLNDYAVFWFRKGGDPRKYSFWAADAYYNRYLVNLDKAFLVDLLNDLGRNYQTWEETRMHPNGMFWQNDGQDGMECAIGGTGIRPTINAYMYGDARAIARIAELAGRTDVAATFRAKAAALRDGVQKTLWDPEAKFFKVVPTGHTKPADVRELLGYVPWYFNLPEPGKGYEEAWAQLMDPKGFYAPYGPTTAEQRHPRFMFAHGHECLWNGPSWPFATTQTLVALANVLNNYPQDVVSKKDYFETLRIYARSQHLKTDDGKVVPWIDENLHPQTGVWQARSIMTKSNRPDKDRGRDYNHSGFCDLVITGLVGLRPREDNTLVVNPLVPEGTWDYFCLDRVLYHGRLLTILYDRTGKRYGRGRGLQVFADGKPVASSDKLEQVSGKL